MNLNCCCITLLRFVFNTEGQRQVKIIEFRVKMPFNLGEFDVLRCYKIIKEKL